METGLARAQQIVTEMYAKDYVRYSDLWSKEKSDNELLSKMENRLATLNDVLISIEIELRKL